MAVEAGLDTGGVFGRVELDIGPDETADALRSRLVDVGSDLLVRHLRAGLGQPEPQIGDPTYADKIQPSELEIDWAQPAALIHRQVRIGGAWTTFRGKRLKIWTTAAVDSEDETAWLSGQIEGLRVGTGVGPIELVEVQPEGKARQPATAWRNGAQPGPTDRLGA